MAKIIPSVKKAFEILELFLSGEPSISVPEITSRLGFPRTTAHELVQTLLPLGYLEKSDTEAHRFTLGLRVFELSGVYASQLDITDIGQKVARKISKKCDETVQMAILDGSDAVFIVRVDSSHTLRLVSAVGSRLPAHCTAVGKMLLSALSNKVLQELYSSYKRLPKMTANSITSKEKLISELKAVRKRGYAYDDCESNEDARCVAAPVYDQNKKICAAISITVPVTRMDANRRKVLATIVKKGAEELSQRLGYKRANI
jgi:DNA-binding IclR family transcriptional regulator